ncbi:hypothetical protein BH10ACI1_BH10ACI1_07370 [soil metagenome]
MKELALINSRLDGRYDVQSILGRGSYAEIYVARDVLASPQSPHTQIVIKALNVFLQNDLDADLERTLVENFQNEAIALDRVRHPNIISRLGHGSARDLSNTTFHYLVLEYLSGGDLAKMCREKSLSFSQALYYLEQICAGLSFAHKHGIIHRDIKPQNLLLTADKKTVKIADFGVARITQSDSPITRVGTNIYAPPEHSPMLTADTQTIVFTELTPAADIYSLAKSAYVLITGESPRFFTNQPIIELPFNYRREPWAEKLLQILTRATQTDSRLRHQTVIEFWQDLSKLKTFVSAVEGEIATQVKKRQPNLIPQPHVAKGYTPLAPQKPRFNTSRNLRLNPNLTVAPNPNLVVRLDNLPANNLPAPQPKIAENGNLPVAEEIPPTQKKPKRVFLRRFIVYFIAFAIFTGILFGTYNYFRGRNILPYISNPLTAEDATAITNINLRSDANRNSEQIGTVTTGSRLKILDNKGIWYKVRILEQGNPSDAGNSATDGWISGRDSGKATIKMAR